MDINFDLEVTPDAEVQLIFDSKVGDVMKGHGSGNLNINLNKKVISESQVIILLKMVIICSLSVIFLINRSVLKMEEK